MAKKTQNDQLAIGQKIEIKDSYLCTIRSGWYNTFYKRYSKFHASDWMGCREEFYRYKKKLKFVLFAHPSGKGNNVLRFIRRAEKKLGLTHLTIGGPTNKTNVMWLEVSPWWSENGIRRSFFTILLRCGRKYEKNNFVSALFSESYAKNSEYAVRRFFDGNTIYTGNKAGWYSNFCQLRYSRVSKEEIDKLLVKGKNS